MALAQVTVGVDERDLAVDWAAMVVVLGETARGAGMEGHCMLHLEAEAAESAAVVVDLDVALAKQRLAVMRRPLVAGPSSSWVTFWARQPQPVPAAVSVAVHQALLLHFDQRLVAADSAQHGAISS